VSIEVILVPLVGAGVKLVDGVQKPTRNTESSEAAPQDAAWSCGRDPQQLTITQYPIYPAREIGYAG
jgi:hypothetical protein